MTLEPTHTCFDDALDFLDLLAKHRPSLVVWPEWRLVHALCTAPNGELYAHAWVECRDVAVFAAVINGGDKEYYETDRRDFYRQFRPVEMNRYTVREAIMHNARTNHFGPWEARYREFSGGKRIWMP
jgi:hypothetical protein